MTAKQPDAIRSIKPEKLKRSRPTTAAAAALAVTLLLGACGGGGGSVDVTPPSERPTVMEGYLVKGPVAGATVCAYRLVAGKMDTSNGLGCGNTDALGRFRFLLSPTSDGMVGLKTNAGQGVYTDEFTGQSARLNIPLSSATRVFPNTTNLTVISPFTEIAVRRAQTATEGLTEATVNDAMTHVARSFDLPDLRATRPADPTRASDWIQESTVARKYGLALAAVSAMGQRVTPTPGQPPIAATLDQLSTTAFKPNLAGAVEADYLGSLADFARSSHNATGLSVSNALALFSPALAELGKPFGTLPAIAPAPPPPVKPNDGPACMATFTPLPGNLAHGGEIRVCVRKVVSEQCNGTTMAPVLSSLQFVQKLFLLGPWSVGSGATDSCEVTGVSEIVDL